MSHTYRLTVASPDGNLFEGDVYSLSLRGVEGELAILAGHAPFVTSVVPCTCRIEEEDGTEPAPDAEEPSLRQLLGDEEEYRADGLYCKATVRREDLHRFIPYLVQD